MKRYAIAIMLLSISTLIHGQSLDSIKYDHGYLYYRTYGKGETIILLTGGPGNNALQLESVAVNLSKQYRTILFEQRGTGLSIPTPFDSSTINRNSAISDINLLLTHLKLQKAIFLGHSYGSSLAMIFASQFPQKVKSLILIAPGYMSLGWPYARISTDNMFSKLGLEEKQYLFQLLGKKNTGKISSSEKSELDTLMKLPYLSDKSKIDSLMPLVDGHNNEKTFKLLQNDFMNYNFDTKKDLQKIKAPFYLISGRQDFLSYIAYDLKIAMPSINLFWIDKSGHYPMYEQPVAFYQTLNQILNELKNYR